MKINQIYFVALHVTSVPSQILFTNIQPIN